MPVLPWLVSVLVTFLSNLRCFSSFSFFHFHFHFHFLGLDEVVSVYRFAPCDYVSRSHNVLRIFASHFCITIWDHLDYLISDISCIEYKLGTSLFHYLKRIMAN